MHFLYFQKVELFKENEKEKLSILINKSMQTYCLGCQIHTDNICPIKLIMTNKEFKGKSKCADCMWN